MRRAGLSGALACKPLDNRRIFDIQGSATFPLGGVYTSEGDNHLNRRGEDLMRQSISKFMLMIFSAVLSLGLVGFAQTTSTGDNDADKAKDHRDIRQDTRDIHRDKRDRRTDRRDIRPDRRDIRKDQADINHDKAD